MRFINWIEALDAFSQLDVLVRNEIMGFIEDLVIPQEADGEPDPIFGRSVRFEVRSDLLLFCDIDQASATVELLSIELLVAKTGLA